MNTKKMEMFFSLFLLLVFLMSVIFALGYDKTTRIFPLVIGIPGLILSAIIFSSFFIPAVEKRLNKLRQKEFFQAYDRDEQKDDDGKKKIREREFKKKSLKEFNIIIWIIGLLISVYILGFLISTPIFIFLFVKFREKESLKMSILISVGTWVVTYVGFIVLLKAQLYTGLFF